MAKLTILLLALAASLLLAQAHRTTVIIDEEETSKPSSQKRCQEQFRKQQNLRSCQEYIQQEAQEDEGGLRRRTERENPYRNGRQDVQDCCDELEELDSQCRCDGVLHAVQQQLQKGQIRGDEERRKAYETARDLPSRCNLSPGRCQSSSIGAV